MTRSRAILAATIAAAALLVAGCDSDSPTTPSPEPTTTDPGTDAAPSASPSAVVVKPDRPAELDDDGPAGAEAAAVYFLELDDYIMKTGDTAEWEAMSQESCEYCTDRLDQAHLIAERGDMFEGGEAQIRVLHTYEQDEATGIWPIDVEIKEARSTITDANGSVVFEQDPQTTTARVEVARGNGQWTIVGVPDVPES